MKEKVHFQLAFPLAESRLVYKPKHHLYETFEEAVKAAEAHPTCSYITEITSKVVWRR